MRTGPCLEGLWHKLMTAGEKEWATYGRWGGLQTRGLCCSDLLFLILTDIVGFLETKGIPYVVMYGTLLGGVRDRDLLPWTADVDLVVAREYWSEVGLS